MKTIIGFFLAIIIIGAGAYWYMQSSSRDVTGGGTEESGQAAPLDQAATTETVQNTGEEIIGKSVEGRDILASHFGAGEKDILFVGGIHGGYEWNTALVAQELIDTLREDPSVVPANVRVTVIPVLNPDGLNKVVGTDGRFAAADVPSSQTVVVSGRFNAHEVDLNRNFDCDWKASGTWQSRQVSGGEKAFSEPESQALKGYVESHNITAAVVWYSAAGGVFASNCHDGVLPETTVLTSLYAKASGYKAYESFDFYSITGDAVNWLAQQKIPAISVLLTTHTNVEWDKNLQGIKALLAHYAE